MKNENNIMSKIIDTEKRIEKQMDNCYKAINVAVDALTHYAFGDTELNIKNKVAKDALIKMSKILDS